VGIGRTGIAPASAGEGLRIGRLAAGRGFQHVKLALKLRCYVGWMRDSVLSGVCFSNGLLREPVQALGHHGRDVDYAQRAIDLGHGDRACGAAMESAGAHLILRAFEPHSVVLWHLPAENPVGGM